MKNKQLTKEEVCRKLQSRETEIQDLENKISRMENQMWDIKRAERAEGYREAIEQIVEVLKGGNHE